MLTAAGSPLVSGGHSPDAHMAQPKTFKVKVLRAFLIKAEPQKVGAVLEVDRALAYELASANKVEILKAEADAPPAAPAVKATAASKPKES